ncbi:cilia- and flagella-associated protein 100 [Apus apus]|uniref:cilia- and flagella-associated protein 100 n=1 Tax=Apus apus TaxID=8895 RepID=UPI0021F875B0|nr:cilia- and flagella-associated protein 100 [Apus apus]
MVYLLFEKNPEENTMKNPFILPPIMDIFSILDKERKKAKEERERMKTMKIHEKMTQSTKMKAKQKGLRKALQEEEEARKQATDEEKLKTQQGGCSCKIVGKNDYPLEKETAHDYRNFRRELFLLEYAKAVKQDEIQRIENIAKKEERKLEKSEYSLKKDVAAFDEFLKENQKKTVEALKIAKIERTAKTKKATEVQAITSEIENLQSDISRLQFTLQEYKMYRDFLYELSPKEWQKEHGKKHRKKKDLKTSSTDNEESASPPTMAEQGQGPTARTNADSPIDVPSSLLPSESLEFSSAREIRPQRQNFPEPLSTGKLSFLEDAESETSSDEDEEPELYFTDPQQLLSAFMERKEEILSLLQSFQEAEENLGKVQHNFITTRESMEKLEELKQQVDTLKSSVAKEEKRVADLKLKVNLFSLEGDKADDQDKMLASLNKKVLEVYWHCTGENKTNLQTTEMLMVIEKQLNDLLDNLEIIPPETLKQAEKARRKELRKRRREEKLRQQQQQEEERRQRALERTMRALETPSSAMNKQKNVFRPKPARKQKKKHNQE